MRRFILCLVVLLFAVGQVQATALFSDNFDSGASPLWGNEDGAWEASGGVYEASAPSAVPGTYSSLPYDLTDFSISVDMYDIGDGGLWLRSSDNRNGVLLVTGGDGWWNNPVPGANGRALYWHVFVDMVDVNWPVQGRVEHVFEGGVTDATIRVDVVGDTYKAYVDDVLVATLVDSTYSHGQVALYDSSAQYFDNVVLEGSVVPEPSTLILLLTGALGFLLYRRK